MRVAWLPAIVLVASQVGCAALEDYHYRRVHEFRSEVAWHREHPWMSGWGCSADYARGWRAGYLDVSTGGCGEPPPVPPSRYWSTVYQSEAGRSRIEEWFTGFQDGATAALSAGVDVWHPIPTGPTVPDQQASLPGSEGEGVWIPDTSLPEASTGAAGFTRPPSAVGWPALPPNPFHLAPAAPLALSPEQSPEALPSPGLEPTLRPVVTDE